MVLDDEPSTSLPQWRRQRGKAARSFRGQKILQPGHPSALFSSKKLTTLFTVTF